MHILIIPSWYPQTPSDANGIFFRLQAQALQRAGHQVGVIAGQFRSLRYGLKPILFGRYGIEHYIEENIPTYIYHNTGFFPHLPFLERHAWLKAGHKLFERYVADHGMPDILHAHCVNQGGIIACDINKKYRTPYVITEHSSMYARGLIHQWQRPSMRQAAENAAARIAVSHDFAKLLNSEYNGLNWDYIPNLLAPRFCADTNLSSKPQNEHFTFCSVANLNPNKGFDVLLQAFALARKKYPHFKLDIGGGGAIEGRLKELVHTLDLQTSVRFLGKLDNNGVMALMRQSDAFTLASHIETFGVVFIEALSQGLPVVATCCGGPESIINANNGLLVETNHPQQLADALVKLYENRQQYDAATLRQQTLAEFGEQAIVDQLNVVYQKVIHTSF